MEAWKTHTPKYGCIFNLFSKEGETIGVHCRDRDSEHSSSQYLVSTRLIGLSMTLGISLQGKTLDLIKAFCKIDGLQGALSKE